MIYYSSFKHHIRYDFIINDKYHIQYDFMYVLIIISLRFPAAQIRFLAVPDLLSPRRAAARTQDVAVFQLLMTLYVVSLPSP
jgi:hypothetical protein